MHIINIFLHSSQTVSYHVAEHAKLVFYYILNTNLGKFELGPCFI